MASDIGPGSLVYCVKGGPIEHYAPDEDTPVAWPVSGWVYMVRAVTATGGVLLVDVPDPPDTRYHRPAWSIRRFRPIDPRALDSIRNVIRTPEEVG